MSAGVSGSANAGLSWSSRYSMSRLLAAGCARSRFQSVSVVPTIRCRPHGMTNSTLVSVRRISPASPGSRSAGTSRWTPFEARTRSPELPPYRESPTPSIAAMSSLHTPIAAATQRARTSMSAPPSRSRTATPVTRSPSRSNRCTLALDTTAAPYRAAVRATVRVCRASSTWPSQYSIAPTSESARNARNSRTAPWRPRCRCRGNPRAGPNTPARRSYRAMPAP